MNHVLGKPCALVLNTIGSTIVVVPNKLKNNVIHAVLVKWFDNELKNEIIYIYVELRPGLIVPMAGQVFQSYETGDV